MVVAIFNVVVAFNVDIGMTVTHIFHLDDGRGDGRVKVRVDGDGVIGGCGHILPNSHDQYERGTQGRCPQALIITGELTAKSRSSRSARKASVSCSVTSSAPTASFRICSKFALSRRDPSEVHARLPDDLPCLLLPILPQESIRTACVPSRFHPPAHSVTVQALQKTS